MTEPCRLLYDVVTNSSYHHFQINSINAIIGTELPASHTVLTGQALKSETLTTSSVSKGCTIPPRRQLAVGDRAGPSKARAPRTVSQCLVAPERIGKWKGTRAANQSFW